MAKLKPPATLEKVAFDVLLRYVIRCCDRLSAKRSLDEFRQVISVIKRYICTNSPPLFLAEFFSRFLREFSLLERPTCRHKAALEIAMDIEIVGLKCEGPIVAHLEPQEAHRFRGLEDLDLSCFPDTATINLANFHLEHLTTFIFPRNCTDSDLTVIGENCSKLQVVKVRHSKNVTDKGLRALSSCSEIRVIDILGCSEVSYIGIDHLLSVHEKLDDFACGVSRRFRWLHDDGVKNYVCSYFSPTAQCASMKRLYVDLTSLSNTDLSCIVAKFPNLTHLGMNNFCTNSLSALTSLTQLTGLEVNFIDSGIGRCHSYDVKLTLMNLEKILPSIGENITSLKFCCAHLRGGGLKFLIDSCPNIECLKFDHKYGLLVVPPFKKLKELTVCCPVDLLNYTNPFQGDGFYPPDSVLQFPELVKLETLTFVEFQVSAKAVESMMLDAIKFPNLSAIETNGLTDHELSQLERNARIKNINFQVKNHPSNHFPNRMVDEMEVVTCTVDGDFTSFPPLKILT